MHIECPTLYTYHWIYCMFSYSLLPVSVYIYKPLVSFFFSFYLFLLILFLFNHFIFSYLYFAECRINIEVVTCKNMWTFGMRRNICSYKMLTYHSSSNSNSNINTITISTAKLHHSHTQLLTPYYLHLLLYTSGNNEIITTT